MRTSIPMKAAILAACAALGACSTVVEAVDVDESFTRDAVLGRDVVVGGVASGLNALTRDERGALAHELHEELTGERGDLQVAPLPTLEDSLGTERLDGVLERFGESGRLTAGDLGDVAGALPTSYVVFARIRRDTTEYDRREEKIEGNRDRVEAVYSTVRHVHVGLLVLDTDLGAVVWSGTIRAKKDVHESEVEFPDWAVVRAMETFFGAGKRDGHPAPPSQASVARRAFERFARELP